jgi:hypothetical protein
LASYCDDYLLTIGRVIYQCTEFGFTFSKSYYHETNVVSLAHVVNEDEPFLPACLAGDEGDLALGQAERHGEELNQGLVRLSVNCGGLESDFDGITMKSLNLVL